MKAKVVKTFRDKTTKSVLKPGQIIEITEERFGELTGPFDIFVEEIKEEPTVNPPKDPDEKDNTPTVKPSNEEDPTVQTLNEHNNVISTVSIFEKMTKAEIVEYAAKQEIQLNMEMTKTEMIEILLKK